MSVERRRARSCAAVAGFVLATAACAKSVGPLELRIDTGGVPVPDFVVEWSEIHGGLDGSNAVRIATAVVSSEEPVVLDARVLGRDVSEVIAGVVHPEFDYAYTGAGVDAGGPVELPPVRPASWDAKLAADGDVTAERVAAHLERLRRVWAPAFGADRSRLRTYLPDLAALAAAAHPPAEDARLRETLAAELAELDEALR